MNPTDTMPIDEAQIHLLFEEAGLMDAPVVDQRRVDGVMERAMHESIIKDTSSFVFLGFPAVLSAMLDVASGKISNSDSDYRA
ncbi:MAG: hypothetical protein AB8F34_00045 [Akkermansiaceae bacterium]